MERDPTRWTAAAELFFELGAASGIDRWPPPPAGATPATPPAAPSVPAAAPPAPRATAAPPATAPAGEALAELAATIARCDRCTLCESRTQTVPGEGAAQPRIVFVGEAPGADEDASGRPFVGAAGQLLTKIIENGLGLAREDVFIANVLKCRPPGNRDPEPGEKAACAPYLDEQLRILQPELVIALGRHAANHLLGRDASLRSLRGKLHRCDRLPAGTLMLATYHPAYLLRTPAAKADCWADLQLGMQHLGMTPPRPPGRRPLNRMARAIGFHRSGPRVAYALVERRPDAPPEVLAAGHCDSAEVGEIYARLGAERALPWALAEERGDRRASAPDDDFELRRPAPRAMVHPAVAAAVWEYDLGRLQDDDLFFWLRPERLLWSYGEPGVGPAGTEARRGPLGASVQRALLKVGSLRAEVVVAIEGDAPGGGTLLKTLEERGRASRPVKRPAAERGADRAAAGAALGALEIARPGFYAPVRPRTRDPWLWTASFLAAAAVGGAAWVSREDARAAEKPAASSPSPQPAARLPRPVPPELQKLLARRRAVVRAFEALPPTAPAGTLEELEVLSAPESSTAQVRMRLLPGGTPDEPQAAAWRQPLLPGFDLEATRDADGSQTIRGEVAGEAEE